MDVRNKEERDGDGAEQKRGEAEARRGGRECCVEDEQGDDAKEEPVAEFADEDGGFPERERGGFDERKRGERGEAE